MVNQESNNTQMLIEKWNPVLNAEGVEKITDRHRLAVTAQLLENQEKGIREERRAGNDLLLENQTNAMGASSSTAGTGNIDAWDPVLISLVRRSAPNMIGFDIAGVQPMNGPVGLIFCMKSRYVTGDPRTLDRTKPEALFNEADTGFSGDGTATAGDPSGLPTADNVYTAGTPGSWANSDDADLNGLNDAFGVGTGVDRSTAETFSSDAAVGDANYLEEMGFTIEKTSVTAKSRALRASYTVELMQDLRAVHGLDAEAELSNILSSEILNEINRELIRTVNRKAKLGAQHSGLTNVANGGPGGVFDLSTDADGRWSVEKYRGLLMQMEREANSIAKDTRRGRGNFALVSSDVASALNAAGILDYGSTGQNGLNVDDTGNLFAGMIGNRIRVFIDPFATIDYMTMGYKGASPLDSGIYYAPYIPLTPYRAVHSQSFQPNIAFRTRYGIASNPFAEDTPVSGVGNDRSNVYFRVFKINNILA